MKHFWTKIITFVVFLVPAFIYLSQQKVYSTPVTFLQNQLSSAQLSYFARLDAGTTAGNSNINVALSGNPSNNTNNLFIGDTLAIGNSGVGFSGSTQYIVSDIANTKTISLNMGLASANAFTGAYIIATRSAVHTVSFYPQDSVSGGKWQVLIKATNTSGELYNDGMPDQNGFDSRGLVSGDITCPWSTTASVGTTTLSGNLYNLITCTLGAGNSNPINENSQIVIGGTNKLINPSPATGHTSGTSDVYTFYLRHLDASNNIISTNQAKIAVNDNVQIIATIDPTITFYIDAVDTSTPGMTRCGTTLGANAGLTTSTSVNFGSLSLGQANTLAQRFSCSTNAQNGYVVQVFEDKELTVTGGGTATIADTDCDVATNCTTSSEGSWDEDLATSQFGYSLEAISSSPVTFSAGADFQARPFGIGFANAQSIMSRNTTPSATDQAYICYRITASNSQQAGTYQNQINYIATATF